VVLALASVVVAQSQSGAPAAPNSAPPRGSGNAKKDKARPPLAVTPEREAAVMTFVQRNHAELADLLASLEASQPQEYERAVREIFRTTERLALVQERDPLQYELEIAVWTAQSRAQLLVARLNMGESDELKRQLRAALDAQADAKLALLKHERQKVADRLAKMDREIANFEGDREDVLERQLQVLMRAASQGRAKLAPKAAKPAKN
jgi:hypothetical protein